MTSPWLQPSRAWERPETPESENVGELRTGVLPMKSLETHDDCF